MLIDNQYSGDRIGTLFHDRSLTVRDASAILLADWELYTANETIPSRQRRDLLAALAQRAEVLSTLASSLEGLFNALMRCRLVKFRWVKCIRLHMPRCEVNC